MPSTLASVLSLAPDDSPRLYMADLLGAGAGAVLVIGLGGGLDVWFGLQSGAREIVAVEVNPASARLVKDYADYHGDLYG